MKSTNSSRSWRRGLMPALLALSALAASAAHAGPYIWDQDDNALDDRIESVQLLGYRFSFENGDTLLRQRFEVTRVLGSLAYGVYVVYDHDPTQQDIDSLGLIGMPMLYRFEGTQALRSVATFVQANVARSLAHVERIEAVPILYPESHEGVAAIGAYDASGNVFPTWSGTGGADGTGVVVAILDSGINDEADGSYPGHESLAGRVIGGASYLSPDSSLDTPRNGSNTATGPRHRFAVSAINAPILRFSSTLVRSSVTFAFHSYSGRER